MLNSGSNTTPSSGQQAQAHPLSEAWNIDPAELAVCQFPDGSDWLLGTGSFGESHGPERESQLWGFRMAFKIAGLY